MARSLDLDELVEHWTLLDDELALIAGKRGPTRLGFALLLKFYTRLGRFPRGRGELPDEAVAFLARMAWAAIQVSNAARKRRVRSMSAAWAVAAVRACSQRARSAASWRFLSPRPRW